MDSKVQVTVDEYVSGVHDQYAGMIRPLVDENARLSAANEQLRTRCEELAAVIDQLNDEVANLRDKVS